jgi:glycosyl transferase family 2
MTTRPLPTRGADRLPRVTVVIPCYNYGHYLPACLESVLSQHGVEVDALVIDDASTDGSAAVARGLAAADPRITLIAHSANRGHIATYNEGLSQATGDYVVLLSADDMLIRGSLARSVAVMEAHPGVGLVYGHPVLLYDGQPTGAPRMRTYGARVWSGPDWISAQCRRGLSCIFNPEVVVRTSVQHEVGPYSSALRHTADLEMWLRIAAVADVARVRGSDQAYRRMHEASMMHTEHAGILADLSGRREAYEAFFAGPGAQLPRAARDLARARRRLAEEALDHACTLKRDARATAEPPDEYVRFAEQTAGRAAREIRQWREFALLDAATSRSRPLAGAFVRCSAVRRDLEGRYRWRRWRYAGV